MSRNVTRADCRRPLLFVIPAAALTALAFAADGGAGPSDAKTVRLANTTISPATPLASATGCTARTTSPAAANQPSERNILPPVFKGYKDQRTVIPAFVGQVAKAWWNGPLSYQSTNDKAYTFNVRSVTHPPLHNDAYTVEGVTYTVNHLRTRYTFTVSGVTNAHPRLTAVTPQETVTLPLSIKIAVVLDILPHATRTMGITIQFSCPRYLAGREHCFV